MNSNLSLIDETFSRENLDTFHLSIQVGMENISAVVLDKSKNRYVALESYSLQGVYNFSMLCDRLELLAQQSPILSAFIEKKTVNASIINNKSTLVPSALFEEKNKDVYLNFNHTPDEGENICKDEFKSLETVNLFAIPGILESTLKKLYPGISICHHSTPLLESLLGKYRNSSGVTIFTHVQLSHFEIIVLQGKTLLFYNSFQYQTSEDFIYYILFVYEQLKLNPEKDPLTLLGEVDRNSAIFDMLYKYIREVKFIERPDAFEYSYKFSDLPPQYFYNLFNQYLCV